MNPVAPYPVVSSRRAITLGIATLVLTATALSARPAHADNLDAALLKHAPEMINYLRDHHCRNVGVLKFRVHKAGHPVTFKAGTINENIVERLENALIAVNPTESSVGVIRRRQPHRRREEAAALRQPSRPARRSSGSSIRWPGATLRLPPT